MQAYSGPAPKKLGTAARVALDEGRGRLRARAGRVRVSEHVFVEQPQVLLELRGGVQRGAHEIEVDVTLGVQAGVVGGAQLLEQRPPDGLERDDAHARAFTAGKSQTPLAHTS